MIRRENKMINIQSFTGLSSSRTKTGYIGCVIGNFTISIFHTHTDTQFSNCIVSITIIVIEDKQESIKIIITLIVIVIEPRPTAREAIV